MHNTIAKHQDFGDANKTLKMQGVANKILKFQEAPIKTLRMQRDADKTLKMRGEYHQDFDIAQTCP